MILLDEPAAGLDEAEAAEMLATVRRLAPGAAVVLVVESADRVVVLHEGKVLAEGRPCDVLDDPVVRKFYLGDAPGPQMA